MPVTITVSQVRSALYQAERGEGPAAAGAASTALLGQWFHEGLQTLVGRNSRENPLTALADLDADLDQWKTALRQRLYEQFVGPRLSQQQALLQDVAPQVLCFWEAMVAACDWIAELSWSIRSAASTRSNGIEAPWDWLADQIQMEEPLSCELRETGWSDSVRLTGIADAVVRLKGTGAWCALEFKSGGSSATADLGQACLYHLLLTAFHKTYKSVPMGEGTAALVRFQPDRREFVFTDAELQPARQRLIDLIGQLAGVGENVGFTPVAVAAPKPNPQARNSVSSEVTEEHHQLGQAIVSTLSEYGVTVVLDQPISAGPAFLRFPISLGRGTRVQAVEQRTAELQVRLRLKAEPFISRDSGGLVVDIQRPDRQTVYFSEILSQLPAPHHKFGGSKVPIGVDLRGNLECADLSKPEHAHMLIAGTTGSGKSEWLRMAVAGLMQSNTPETLRLLIIDPKRNAFHALRDSPFLWQPLVFPDECSTVDVLARLVEEMENRYRKLDGADSFTQFAERSAAAIPRIVCVCDEYRDLISRDRKERKAIETLIGRLGAKARAAGINLMLATQEPSRDTIKGPLDSNIPARVGLKMGKGLESTMLLNETGAEKLLGHGDLLFKDIGDPRRLQAPLLTEEDRQAIFGAPS